MLSSGKFLHRHVHQLGQRLRLGDSLLTDGVANYTTLSNLPNFNHYFDTKRIARWIYSPATQTFWSFDDPLTVTAKMVYV